MHSHRLRPKEGYNWPIYILHFLIALFIALQFVLSSIAFASTPKSGFTFGSSSFFFSSRRRHTRYIGDWSSDVCSSDLVQSSRNPSGHGVRACDHRHAVLVFVLRDHLGFSRIGRSPRRQSRPRRQRSRSWRSEERRVGKEGRSRWSARPETRGERKRDAR